MNTRRSSSRFGSLHALFLLMSAALLLSLGATSAPAAQVDTQLLALNYVDKVIEQVDLNAASELLGPTSMLYTPEGVFQGSVGAQEFASDLNAAFSNLEFAVERVDVAGEVATIQFTLTGINTGSYQDLSAGCAGIAVPGVAVLTFSGSVVTEQWIAYDQDAIRAQILAFNAIDPSSRPTCSGSSSQPTSSPELAPVCTMATAECGWPY